MTLTTWKRWLEEQRQGQQEPWILTVDTPSASHTSRSGVNMLHLDTHTQPANTQHLEHFLRNGAMSKPCRMLDGTSHTGAAQALMLGWPHFQLSWLCRTKTIVCLVSEEYKLGHALFEHNWENIYTKQTSGQRNLCQVALNWARLHWVLLMGSSKFDTQRLGHSSKPWRLI